MAGFGQQISIKRSLSEEAEDDLSPPTKLSSKQVKLKGRAWNKHPQYYFEDGSLTLLVEETAYRVQGSMFISCSPHWKDTLGSEPRESFEPQELTGVMTDEMDAFLSLLYPSSFDHLGVTTSEGWAYVLHLSDLWRIPSMRSLALAKLDAIATPLHKLVLARSYKMPGWIEPSIDALARRAEPLSLDEANMLGMEDVLRVSAMREAIRTARPGSAPAPTPVNTQTPAPTPVNTQTPARGPPADVAPAPAEARPPKPPLPKITVPFTRRELEDLSTILSGTDNFHKIFPIVTMPKIPAFCHAVADFSNLLRLGGLGHHSLCDELFKYTAINPAYIPVAVKIASFIVLHNDYHQSLLGQGILMSSRGLRTWFQHNVSTLRGLSEGMAEAKAKYPDFKLAWKSGARNHSSAPWLLGLSSFREPPQEAVYNERITNAARFTTALMADDLRLVT